MRPATILRAVRRWLAAAALLALPAVIPAAPALARERTLPAPVASSPAPPAPAAAAPVETLTPALWLVADADTRIYLFGTIHVLAPGLHWFDGAIAEAFAASDGLITEVVDVGGGGGGLEGTKALLKQAMLPQGQTLSAMLPAEDRAAMKAALAKAGVPVSAIDRLKPWYAAIVLSSLPLIQAGYRLDHGVEMELAKRAREAGKPQDAMETAAYQLSLFDGLSEASQLAYLRRVIANLDNVTSQIATIVDRWGAGDAEGLAQAMNADMSDPALQEAVLDRRNRTWAEWIRQRLDQPGTVFVAVGAGHLAGSMSVQNELAARGIVARRVQ